MFVDFQEIKQQVSFDDAIEYLKLDLTTNNNQLRGKCPTCNGSDRALVITPGKGFYCFDSAKGGDVIELTSHIRQIDVKNAGQYLADRLEEKTTTIAKTPSESINVGGLQALSHLDPEHMAVSAIGFPDDVAERVGIGFCSKGMMKDTVAVPIRLPDSTLIGYIGLSNEMIKLPKVWRLPDEQV